MLFTSYATMRAVQAIAEMALDYPILVQGTRAALAAARSSSAQTPHAVLFATSSFWQGVDVVGEALSCVIIDKLPFASPGDPITAARIDAIRARGGEPFGEYQVPLAILALQQGLGRLIRHRRDRGVLAVLDPRLRTKGYGRRFIASLPPAPVVHDLVANRRVFFCLIATRIGKLIGASKLLSFLQEEFHGPPIERPASVAGCLRRALALAIALPAAAQSPGWSKAW